jgi:hypothetical protein
MTMSKPDTNSRCRYFYTDPLAAAWMSKHFGMKFNEPYDFAVMIRMYDMSRGKKQDIKYYIHPDSLHLLEPMEGDYVTVFGAPRWVRYAMRTENKITVQYDVDGPEQIFSQSEVAKGIPRIIQRSGKAFHWPESEAV